MGWDPPPYVGVPSAPAPELVDPAQRRPQRPSEEALDSAAYRPDRGPAPYRPRTHLGEQLVRLISIDGVVGDRRVGRAAGTPLRTDSPRVLVYTAASFHFPPARRPDNVVSFGPTLPLDAAPVLSTIVSGPADSVGDRSVR